MTTAKLKSVGMVYMPGLIRYLQHVYSTDSKHARGIFFAAFPTLKEEQFQDLMSGAYTVEGEDVLLEMD